MFKLDKLVIFTLVLLVGTLGMSGAAIAGKGNGPAPHATGSDVEFLRCHLQLQSWISFNAHEAYNGRPAKGELHYRDVNGDWLDGDVGCVTIEGEDAIFSGLATATNREDWEDKYFHIAVHDGGTPGRKGDLVWISLMRNNDPGCITYPDYGPYPVDSGNLVVHSGHNKVGLEDLMPLELKAGPNPFNATALVSYSLPEDGTIRLEVFDLAGRKVATLADGRQSAGEHKVLWTADNMISGVYFMRLTTEKESLIQKVTLLK